MKLSCKRSKGHYAKQNTSAQLPFHIRPDPLKLPGDPLKVVAGSPRDLHEILTNGNPGAEAIITELIVRMNVPIATADIIEKKTNMTIARYFAFY